MTEMHSKRVLLSAFACSPFRGSEEGIGWHWAVEIANLGYRVTVLTRAIHCEEIMGAPGQTALERLTFEFLDPAPWIRFEGATKPLGYIYYYFWQILALQKARRMHRKTPFDLIHHITYGGIRLPTFLGRLGIPMIVGPLGGGETAPSALRKGYSIRGKLVDAARDLSNSLIRFDPLMHETFSSSSMIILRTRENLKCIPEYYRDRIHFEHDIGVDCQEIRSEPMLSDGPLRILYLGRALSWKGMHLGLRAYAELLKEHPKAKLTLVGDGPDKRSWQRLAADIGVQSQVKWVNWIPHTEVGRLYADNDVLLFPTLHEAGGTVLYEAAAHGRPVICLDLGAPGELVTPEIGFKIAALGRSEADVISDISVALKTLATDREHLANLGAAARKWAETQSWQSRVRNVYKKSPARS
ncbi:MAG TPA: glycosyltransferase family 4 protein [Devosiaceae bacterium]